MRRILLLGALLLLLTPVLSQCGDGSCSTDGDTDASPQDDAADGDLGPDLPGDITPVDGPAAPDGQQEPPDEVDWTGDRPVQTDPGDEEVVWTECSVPPEGLVTSLGEPFDDLLGLLWQDYWSENGDWGDDMMGDATSFAPELLFPMAGASGCRDLRERAIATVDWEVALIGEYLDSGSNAMETMVGAPALITGYEWTGNLTYKLLAAAGLNVLADQVLQDPEAYWFFGSPVVALGSTAYYILQFTQATGDQSLVEKALEAIELADSLYWDEQAGYYRELWDWPQALMIMALSQAYLQTDQSSYLERAQSLASTVLELMWDDQAGGFWFTTAEEAVGKSLSGQAFMTRAFITLYLATCHRSYLDVAIETLEYSFGPDLYLDGLIRHDWTPQDGTSTDVCTGCNFFVLSNLWMVDRVVPAQCP